MDAIGASVVVVSGGESETCDLVKYGYLKGIMVTTAKPELQHKSRYRLDSFQSSLSIAIQSNSSPTLPLNHFL